MGIRHNCRVRSSKKICVWCSVWKSNSPQPSGNRTKAISSLEYKPQTWFWQTHRRETDWPAAKILCTQIHTHRMQCSYCWPVVKVFSGLHYWENGKYTVMIWTYRHKTDRKDGKCTTMFGHDMGIPIIDEPYHETWHRDERVKRSTYIQVSNREGAKW